MKKRPIRLIAGCLSALTIANTVSPLVITSYAQTETTGQDTENDTIYVASFYFSRIVETGKNSVLEEVSIPIDISVNSNDTLTPPSIPDVEGYEFIGWDNEIPDHLTGNAEFHAQYQKVKEQPEKEKEKKTVQEVSNIKDNSVTTADDAHTSTLNNESPGLDKSRTLTEGVYMTEADYKEYVRSLNKTDITELDESYEESNKKVETVWLNEAMDLKESPVNLNDQLEMSLIVDKSSSEELIKGGSFLPFRNFIVPYLVYHSGEADTIENTNSMWLKIFKEETEWSGSGTWADKYYSTYELDGKRISTKGVKTTYNQDYDKYLAKNIRLENSNLFDRMITDTPNVLKKYLMDYDTHPEVSKAVIAHINNEQAKLTEGEYVPILYDENVDAGMKAYFLNLLIHNYKVLNPVMQKNIGYFEWELAVAYRQDDAKIKIDKTTTKEAYDIVARSEISARPIYRVYDIDKMFSIHTAGEKSFQTFNECITSETSMSIASKLHQEFFNYVVSTDTGIGKWLSFYNSTVYNKYDKDRNGSPIIWDNINTDTSTQWINLNTLDEVFGGDGSFYKDSNVAEITNAAQTDVYLASMPDMEISLIRNNTKASVAYGKWLERAKAFNTLKINYIIPAGASNSTANPETFTAFDSFTFAKAAKMGYTFEGWYNDPEFKDQITGFNSAWNMRRLEDNSVRKEIPIYGKFTPNTYSLTIDAAGGTCDSTLMALKCDETATIPTPTRTDYDFMGWEVIGGGSKINGNTFTQGYENTTLRAKWKAKFYHVHFNANGGSGSMNAQQIYFGKSTALSGNAFTRNNMVFTGWNTKPDGSGTTYSNGQVVGDLIKEPGTVTLYAQWNSVITIYDYTTDMNGNNAVRQSVRTINGKPGTGVTISPNSYGGYARPNNVYYTYGSVTTVEFYHVQNYNGGYVTPEGHPAYAVVAEKAFGGASTLIPYDLNNSSNRIAIWTEIGGQDDMVWQQKWWNDSPAHFGRGFTVYPVWADASVTADVISKPSNMLAFGNFGQLHYGAGQREVWTVHFYRDNTPVAGIHFVPEVIMNYYSDGSYLGSNSKWVGAGNLGADGRYYRINYGASKAGYHLVGWRCNGRMYQVNQGTGPMEFSSTTVQNASYRFDAVWQKNAWVSAR